MEVVNLYDSETGDLEFTHYVTSDNFHFDTEQEAYDHELACKKLNKITTLGEMTPYEQFYQNAKDCGSTVIEQLAVKHEFIDSSFLNELIEYNDNMMGSLSRNGELYSELKSYKIALTQLFQKHQTNYYIELLEEFKTHRFDAKIIGHNPYSRNHYNQGNCLEWNISGNFFDSVHSIKELNGQLVFIIEQIEKAHEKAKQKLAWRKEQKERKIKQNQELKEWMEEVKEAEKLKLKIPKTVLFEPVPKIENNTQTNDEKTNVKNKNCILRWLNKIISFQF